MPRPLTRVAVVGAFAALLVGCSLLTDLSGFAGGPDDTCADGDCTDARADTSADASGGSDGEGGACEPGDAGDPTLLSDAVALAVGGDFTCALRANATVLCWGSNALDQLGTPGASRSTPATVTGLGTITAIAAGDDFACALEKGGEVWCWGGDADGQLGSGAADASGHLPAKVRGAGGEVLAGVTAIAAGRHHACAAAGGKVLCWGANNFLQLGHVGGGGLVPTEVAGVTNATELDLSGDYSCAVSDDSAGPAPKGLSCWGSNADLQLANTGGNSATPQHIPLRIAAAGAYPIAMAGHGHACARDESNDFWCWGENDFGQLGPGVSPGPSVAGLQRQSALGKVRTAAAGDDYTCAVGTDGIVHCLGLNNAAQLGNDSIDIPPDGGTPPPHTNLTLVNGLPAVDRVAAFGTHTCAILAHRCPESGGQVMCWGSNGDGELGSGTNAPTRIAVFVRAP